MICLVILYVVLFLSLTLPFRVPGITKYWRDEEWEVRTVFEDKLGETVWDRTVRTRNLGPKFLLLVSFRDCLIYNPMKNKNNNEYELT